MKTFFDAANGVLLLLMTKAVIASQAVLPARIPTHYDLLGRPDRWGDKSTLFGLLGVAWGLSLVLYAMILSSRRLTRRPERLNIPHKKQFLKLPPEKQEAYFHVLKEMMAGALVGLNLIWYLILTGTLAIARGEATTLSPQSLLAGTAVTVLILIVYIRRLIILPKKLISGEVM